MPSSPPSPSPSSLIHPASSLAYWSSTPPTLSSVLGGYPQISPLDLKSSYLFLRKLLRVFPPPPPSPSISSTGSARPPTANRNEKKTKREGNDGFIFKRALDCGAGIGRVTFGLLTRVCAVVDIVEPIPAFVQTLQSTSPPTSFSSSSSSSSSSVGILGDCYITPLETFPGPTSTFSSSEPSHENRIKNHEEQEKESKKYDLIWIQWCAGHLPDHAFVAFLKRCKTWLTKEGKGGWVVVKENISTTLGAEADGKGGDRVVVDVYDDLDSSVTRSDASFRGIFQEAGFKVMRSERQRGFEGVVRGLLPVRVYALRVGEEG